MNAAEGGQSHSAAAERLELRRGADMTVGAVRNTAAAASHIINVALNDLASRQGRPPLSGPDDHAAPALRHVIETDGKRFCLARDGDRPVGFGAGLVRGAFSYCAGLFVLPSVGARCL